LISGEHYRRFQRVFIVQDANHTPYLLASTVLEGWSLLSWTGPLMYVGQYTIINPDNRWLPGTMSVVEAWIDEVCGAAS